jgi:hypothetical protein
MNSRERTKRFRLLKQMGCIACLIEGVPVPCGWPEIHHQNLGGLAGHKRRGDEFTVPLGPWHHQGHVRYGETEMANLANFGPSLKRHSRHFREKYGNDDDLRAQVDQRIAEMDMAMEWQPW